MKKRFIFLYFIFLSIHNIVCFSKNIDNKLPIAKEYKTNIVEKAILREIVEKNNELNKKENIDGDNNIITVEELMNQSNNTDSQSNDTEQTETIKEQYDIRFFYPCVMLKDSSEIFENSGDYQNDEIEINNIPENELENTKNKIEDSYHDEYKKDNYIYKNITNNLFNKQYNIKKIISSINKIYNRIFADYDFLELYNYYFDNDFCNQATEFIENDKSLNIQDFITSEKFKDTKFVVNSELEIIDKNNIKIKIFIWDIVNNNLLNSAFYTFNIKEKYENILGDKIADFIYKNVDNSKYNIFNNRILYISETGSPKNRKKQVVLSDFMGTSKFNLTSTNTIKFTPVFSKKDPLQIFYNENINGNFFIVKTDLEKDKKEILTINNLLMTTAPNFHPIDNKILISGTENDGSTNLYLFNLDKNSYSKITNNSFINTSGSFNPAGDKIVYISDKSGVKKLYVKDIYKQTEYLLTKNHGNYDKPAWSPDGETIAFIKINNNDFSLGLIDYNGDNERIIKKNFLIEGLKWTSNPRFLTYTKQTDVFGIGSIPKIYILDLKTGKEKMFNINKKEGASDIDLINYY